MSQLTSFPIDCFDRRPIDQINEDIKLSTNSIDILQIYVSTIALNRRSRELCTFKLHRESPGADRSFGFQFDSIWATSREYK